MIVHHEFRFATIHPMRKALGFLIVLWGLSHFFSSSFSQLDDTASTTLRTISTAAEVSRDNMLQLK